MSGPAISDLLALIEKVLAADPQDQGILDCLDEYAVNFQDWLDRAAKSEKGIEGTPELLAQLEARHRMVIEKASQLRGETAEKLKAMKKRGKGILAYARALPRTKE